MGPQCTFNHPHLFRSCHNSAFTSVPARRSSPFLSEFLCWLPTLPRFIYRRSLLSEHSRHQLSPGPYELHIWANHKVIQLNISGYTLQKGRYYATGSVSSKGTCFKTYQNLPDKSWRRDCGAFWWQKSHRNSVVFVRHSLFRDCHW